MAARRSGLGRGLDSLIPNKTGKEPEKKSAKTEKAEKTEKAKAAKPAAKPAKKKSAAAEPAAKKTTPSSSAAKKTAASAAGTKKTSASAAGTKKTAASSGAAKKTAVKAATEKANTRSSAPRAEAKPAAAPAADGEKVVELKISMVEPNRNQPRKKFKDEAISELADSIRQYGILQPLLVQKEENYYQIIAGERRWRAAKKAGLKTVPAIIKDFSTQRVVEVSLIENIQREDLNPMEEARAYERLANDFSLTQEQIAEKVSKNRSTVANAMRLLKLGADVQDYVSDGLLSEGHARAILALSDPDKQKAAADEVLKNNLSVRETEKLVRELASGTKSRKKVSGRMEEALVRDLCDRLKKRLGTKVNIHQRGRNRGRIEIEYYSEAELDRIFELLESVRG